MLDSLGPIDILATTIIIALLFVPPLYKVASGAVLMMLDWLVRIGARAQPPVFCRLGWHARPRLFGRAPAAAWICRGCSTVVEPRRNR